MILGTGVLTSFVVGTFILLGTCGKLWGAEVDNMVNTAYGQIQGKSMTVFNGIFSKAVSVYNGIPFAKPPVGPLRFALPEDADPWTGVFNATKLMPACPQAPAGAMWATHPLWNDYEEDCLTLNVYTPYDQGAGPYPVYVWFHGGAYMSGSGIQYPGHFLATWGIVVVTVNYRLGNLGFFWSGDDEAPANIGLRDQMQSLLWVQQTISDFGGDPNMVTISGQSAGASSSSLQQVSPHSQHLFHQVLLESGTDMNLWSILNPDSDPVEIGRQLPRGLNCTTEDTHAMVECMRQASVRDIRTTPVACAEGYFCQGLNPMVDGPGGFIPEWPRVMRERGEFNKGNVLSGICRDDGSLYTYFLVDDPGRPGGFDRYNFTKHLKKDLLEIVAGFVPDEMFDVFYREMDWHYAPWPYLNNGTGNLLAYNEIITDGAFGVGWDWHMKMHDYAGSDVYGYIFDYRSQNATQWVPLWMGVPHMGEIPYVWGWPLLQINPAVREDSEIVDIIDWDFDDILVSIYFHQMVANFIKFGNPTPEPVKRPFDEGTTDWKKFTFDEMNYLYVDQHTPFMDTQYRQKEYALFDYLVPSTTGFMFDSSYVLDPASSDAGAPPHGAERTIDSTLMPTKMAELYQKAYPERYAVWEALLESVGETML